MIWQNEKIRKGVFHNFLFKISIIQTFVPFRHDDDKKHKIYLCNLMLSIERWQTCYIRSHQNCLHSVQSLVQPLVCRHEQSSVGLLDCGGEKRVQVLVRWRHGLQVWPLIFHFLGKRKSARSLLICFPGPFNDQRPEIIISLSLSFFRAC